jgi:membrane-bound ClpP family serine protease
MESVYPIKERRHRVMIAGALYCILGAILMSVFLLTKSGIFMFCGGILMLVGVFALGIRRRVRILSDKTVIQEKGFFIVKQKKFLPGQFKSVEIKNAVVLTSTFSRIESTMYMTTSKDYKCVCLVGAETIEVDRSEDDDLVKKWAGEISEALKLPVKELA